MTGSGPDSRAVGAAGAEAFQLLFASNPLPMWVYDEGTLAFLEVNDAAVAQYGFSRHEFLSMRITDIRPEEDVARLHKYLTTDRPDLRSAGNWRHRRRDGKILDVEIYSHNLRFAGRPAVLVVVHDLTEQRRLEEQLLQSQKMDAIGRLAGGIAHDFNNLLTTILGYCQMLLANPQLEVSMRADIEEVHGAASSAAGLTRQLLAFSRKQIIEPVNLDLNSALSRLERMLQRLIGENIQITLRLDEQLKTVLLDPVQVDQIVMNLAVNARDAMPKGGVLTIETANVDLDESYARQHLSVSAGEYVMLAVSDTGKGMSADVLTHVFEPFFTTKAFGQGTGLGLATVYGIVRQNRGHIWVYSEPNQGATIKMYFPALPRPSVRPSPASPAENAPVGTETILVVEDDPRLRLLTRKSLERCGYRVLVTGEGNEALRVAASHEGPIHLLLTDVVMPGLSGKAVATAIARTRPDTRVLYCSGYTEDAIVHHGVLEAGVAFLEKPFTPNGLARKVRDVLDATVIPGAEPL